MTPEEILQIFIERHRLVSPLDPEADETIILSMYSTVDDWRDACDLLPWHGLAKALDDEFEMNATDEEWRSVLKPSYKRTLQDVCNFIGKKSKKGAIVPVKLFGRECLSAAVFKALKKNLSQRNIDTNDIAPSSEISPYIEKYLGEIITETTFLSKGKKVFDSFKPKLKKRGFWNYINIFDNDRYTYPTGGVKTFRDLTLKIVEAQTSE
jgi:hypothetical protein